MIEEIHNMVTKAHNDWMGFLIENSNSPVEAQAKYNDLKEVYITEVIDSIVASASLDDLKNAKSINELCEFLVSEISANHLWDEISTNYSWHDIQESLINEVKGLSQLNDSLAK